MVFKHECIGARTRIRDNYGMGRYEYAFFLFLFHPVTILHYMRGGCRLEATFTLHGVKPPLFPFIIWGRGWRKSGDIGARRETQAVKRKLY